MWPVMPEYLLSLVEDVCQLLGQTAGSFLQVEIIHIHSPIFFFFFLLKTAPVAYGSSWARGCIRATAMYGLRHSHSNKGSKPHLQPMPQLGGNWILHPLSEAREQTCILMDTMLGS